MSRARKPSRPPRLHPESGPDFDGLTRRLLFREAVAGEIPGRGKSAAAQPVRHVRTKVTMNLDGDVVAHFKAQSEVAGLPYQTLINQVLREYIQGSRPERVAEQVGRILSEDESFLELLAERLADMKRT